MNGLLTERDIFFLQTLAFYYVLTREQIQRLCYPTDGSGRITRRRLQMLVDQSFINRVRTFLYTPGAGPPFPIYYPAKKGLEFLAEFYQDDRYVAVCTQPPQAHHVFHWVRVSETHILLNAAIESQEAVQMPLWVNEWEVVNKEEREPQKRYKLYTLLSDKPRRICAPDSLFVLEVGGESKIYMLEQDRATSGVRQEAFSKTPGYTELAARGLQRRFFDATVPEFTVLCLSPTQSRRDAMRKAFKGRERCDLWRFASMTDLDDPETVLAAPVFYACENQPPRPLVEG